MNALDTNVLVRLVVADHPAQHAAAQALLRGMKGDERLLLLPAVLLEAEWVLRDVYGVSPRAIADALLTLCAAERVEVIDAEAVAEAFRLFRGGMDFADALHTALAAAAGAAAILSFDRELARKSKKLGALPVRSP